MYAADLAIRGAFVQPEGGLQADEQHFGDTGVQPADTACNVKDKEEQEQSREHEQD